MREIKFQFIYKGFPHHSDTSKFTWHRKTYTLNQLLKKPLRELSDVHTQGLLIARRQYTGIKDKKCTEIYEGDWLRDKYGKTALVRWWDDNAQFIAVDAYEILIHGIDCAEPAYEFDQSEGWCGVEVIGNLYENPELLERT